MPKKGECSSCGECQCKHYESAKKKGKCGVPAIMKQHIRAGDGETFCGNTLCEYNK